MKLRVAIATNSQALIQYTYSYVVYVVDHEGACSFRISVSCLFCEYYALMCICEVQYTLL
jgi:hypothetical protein